MERSNRTTTKCCGCCKIKKTTHENMWDHFRDYCSITGIHGFYYIGEQRTLMEKVWWIMIMVLSCAYCSFMIYEIVVKFIDSPVQITVSTRPVSIQKIPFPAVTICPQTKVSSDYLDLAEVYKKIAENETVDENTLRDLDFASVLCNDNYKNDRRENGSLEFYEFLNNSRGEFLQHCSYLGKEYNCSDIFTPVLTEEGVCYSFNILDRSEIFQDNVFQYEDYHTSPKTNDWSLENGYSEEVEASAYPRRGLYSGTQNSLVVIMFMLRTDYATCTDEENEGFKVSLHLPARIPKVSEEFFAVPINQNVMAAIIPHFIETSEEVRNYKPNKRDCFFPSERHLKYYKIYTQGNCMTECLTNFTLNACGCVAFHMPRHNSTPICGSANIDCIVEAEQNFLDSLSFSKVDKKSKRVNSMCECLPICTNVDYNLEISQNVGRWTGRFKMLQMWREELQLVHLSSLRLYFKHNFVDTKQRNEVYSFSDFLSNFGGLIGLFTGFSIISFAEIIYFLSLRIVGNIRLYGNWGGPIKK